MNAVTTTEAPRQEGQALAVRSPMESALQLVQAGMTIDQLQAMMQLQLQWEANEARKAYIADMAAFKQNPPEIVKAKLVDFPSKNGRTTYMHATLGDVCDAVIEALARHGFSHRWANRSAPEGMYVSCILTHRLGHSETFEMGPGKPDESGGKNHIQAIASTQTYFQRYSLLGICGLTSNDMRDDDGRGSAQMQQVENEVLQDLVKRLRMTKTDADALAFWNEHKAAFSGDRKAYEAFKDEAAAHRLILREAAAEAEA